MFFGLIQNISLLVTLSAVHQLIMLKGGKDTLKNKILSGLLFGGVAIVGMMMPISFSPGIIFDARSIILGVSGLFGGPVVAFITTAICMTYRFWLGGTGALVDSAVAGEVAALGVGYYFLRQRDARWGTAIPLLCFGLLIHVLMLIFMLALPNGIGWEVVPQISLPVLVIYPLATLLLCRILMSNEDRIAANQTLRESEERYHNLIQNCSGIIWETDASACFTFIGGQTRTLLGYDPSEVIGKPVFDFIDRDSFEENARRFALARDSQEAILSIEIRFVHRNGHIVIIETRATPIYGPGAAWRGFHGIAIDISDRKRAEGSLRDSQERLTLALESSQAGIWDKDLIDDRSIWDDYHHFLFGLAPGTFSGKSEDFISMVHPDDRYRVKDEMAAAIRGDAEYSTTYRVIWPDGTVRFLADRGKVYRDITGRAVRMAGISWDITELKRTEAALRESQRQLADIINFLPDATLVIDVEGKVVTWNRAMEETTGVKAQDILGKGNYEYALPFYGERRPILIDFTLKPEDELELRYRGFKRKDNAIQAEACLVDARGGKVHLFGKASVLRDSKGNVLGAIESIREITDRKRAEEALAVAEEKYRSIFDNAMEGIYQTTIAGRCINANPALADILGYDSPEELMNTVADIPKQLYVNSERRAELLRLIEKYGSVREFETQYFRKDKSIACVSLNMHAVYNEKGKIAYLEGTVQDITDRKGLESRLVQAQKMEAIGTLAGGIAHDFNNILSAVMGYTEIVQVKLTQPDLCHYLEQVLLACNRAKDLVGQILTFSRKTEQERKPLHLAPLIREVFKLLRASLPATIEIRQEIDLNGRADMVLADPTQIHQVLMNLATNAFHAMQERGGELRVCLDNVEITPQMRSFHMDVTPGSYARLSVRDTGTGIAPAVMPRIFDPFFTTKKTGEGTGLGLSVVYGIVKECNGTITVQSEQGKGTTFEVYLPIIHRPMESGRGVSGPIPRGTERILFVDDEEALAEMGRDILTELGYQVVATTSSIKALESFKDQPEFDLVITDLTMPRMTGVELAREVLRLRPGIPIILCTGFTELITEEEAKALGISEFAMKPIDRRHIATLIRKALKKSRLSASTSTKQASSHTESFMFPLSTSSRDPDRVRHPAALGINTPAEPPRLIRQRRRRG